MRKPSPAVHIALVGHRTPTYARLRPHVNRKMSEDPLFLISSYYRSDTNTPLIQSFANAPHCEAGRAQCIHYSSEDEVY